MDDLPAGGTLAVQIAAAGREPERLLLLERPALGCVRLREWSSADWSRQALRRERPVGELLEEMRRADAERRLVGIELYRIERWLDDAGPRGG